MSHVDKIAMEILSIECLNSSVQELGGQLLEKSTYAWYGTHVGDYPLPPGITKEELGKCSYAIKVPGSTWEIGVIKNKTTPGYSLICDWWGPQGRKLAEFVGGITNPTKLKKSYAKHNILMTARQNRHQVQQSVNAKGQQVLRIMVP